MFKMDQSHLWVRSLSSVRQVDSGYWFSVEKDQCRGGVLLAHGLNMNPISWREMIVFLNRLGLAVYRLELKGHRGLNFEDMMDVSAREWLEQFNSAVEFMAEQIPGLPVYLVGYSLGGLLGMVAQLQKSEPCFERQVLLAPALALKLYTRLALPMTRVVSFLASRSPKEYVANTRGTTGAAYQALFDLEREFRSAEERQFSVVNYPTLIIMRPNDELISYRCTKKLIERRELNRWKLAELPKKKTTHRDLYFRHLIIDEKSVGERSWQKLTKLLEEFLIRGE